MSILKRVPNKLKFQIVLSDRSKLEATLPYSDDQWEAIWAILMKREARPKVASPAAHPTE